MGQNGGASFGSVCGVGANRADKSPARLAPPCSRTQLTRPRFGLTAFADPMRPGLSGSKGQATATPMPVNWTWGPIAVVCFVWSWGDPPVFYTQISFKDDLQQLLFQEQDRHGDERIAPFRYSFIRGTLCHPWGQSFRRRAPRMAKRPTDRSLFRQAQAHTFSFVTHLLASAPRFYLPLNHNLNRNLNLSLLYR